MLKDFWRNVRYAAGAVFPPIIADAPMADYGEVERGLQQETAWLTPKTVKGFDPNDFNFLPENDRKALNIAVERFRKIADEIPYDQPPSESQLSNALPQLMQILHILRPDKFNDAEALRIGKQIEARLAKRMPESVEELRFETGEDHLGDPALRIWVVLKDEYSTKERLIPSTNEAHKLLNAEAREVDAGYWPYVRYRSVSDLQAQPQ